MPDRITTHEAAIAEMLAWANGERSHWNAVCDLTYEDANGEGVAKALVSLLDAAEVQKWAAVAGALKDLPPVVYGTRNRVRVIGETRAEDECACCGDLVDNGKTFCAFCGAQGCTETAPRCLVPGDLRI